MEDRSTKWSWIVDRGQRASYDKKRGAEPTTVTKQPKESKIETAAAATEMNELDWLSKMIIDMDQNLQSVTDDIDIMDAMNDDIAESIKEIYD